MPKVKAKAQNKEMPYVENYPPLKAWLDKHKATCNWQLPYGIPEAPRAYVESWAFKDSEGRTQQAIVFVFANNMGWDIFTSANTAEIAKTLADAEMRLGLAKPPAREGHIDK